MTNPEIILRVLIIGLFSWVTVQSSYWCDIQDLYCNGDEHIGCEPNSFPWNEDSKVEVLEMPWRIKRLIVRLHNEYRNSIANGSVKGYPKAKQMKVIKWDEDLADTCELMVAHGVFDHDQCRATETSPDAGQNLGLSQNTEKIEVLNLRAVVKERVQSWFNEHKLTNSRIVDKYESGSGAGHFTAMMRDDTAKIGCAAAYFLDPNDRLPHNTLLCCNYQSTNFVGYPTYIRGEPCTDGKKCHSVYTSLSVN